MSDFEESDFEDGIESNNSDDSSPEYPDTDNETDIEKDVKEETSLETYKTLLDTLLSEDSITNEYYDTETMKANYYYDIRNRQFYLSEDNLETIKMIRNYKDLLRVKALNGEITDSQYDEELTNSIKREYQILRDSETKRAPKNFQVGI